LQVFVFLTQQSRIGRHLTARNDEALAAHLADGGTAATFAKQATVDRTEGLTLQPRTFQGVGYRAKTRGHDPRDKYHFTQTESQTLGWNTTSLETLVKWPSKHNKQGLALDYGVGTKHPDLDPADEDDARILDEIKRNRVVYSTRLY
jgi:hypothetical protein